MEWQITIVARADERQWRGRFRQWHQVRLVGTHLDGRSSRAVSNIFIRAQTRTAPNVKPYRRRNRAGWKARRSSSGQFAEPLRQNLPRIWPGQDYKVTDGGVPTGIDDLPDVLPVSCREHPRSGHVRRRRSHRGRTAARRNASSLARDRAAVRNSRRFSALLSSGRRNW
jgi:hypothetical protein